MNSHNSTATKPLWMKPVLQAAGVYNIAWGLWVVIFPMTSLKVCGYTEVPTYPEFWQCIGMIVGVYGIGYWIAAYNPYRHWPIIFVGFLGKLFGPIGFLNAYITGTLPLSAGIVNIFNDLIWWIPFSAILWEAFRHEQTSKLDEPPTQPFRETLRSFRSQTGVSLAELSNQSQVLVVFLRHSGCTFCREALDEIKKQRETLEAEGIQIAFVHMDDPKHMQTLFERYDVADLPSFSDPQQELYRAFEIGLGRIDQLLSPKVFWKGFLAAIVKRHGFSRVRSNVFRLPGTFLIENEKIVARFYSKDAADHPNFEQFVCDAQGPK